MEEIQGWQAFVDKYKPKKNHITKYNDFMFETYGEEFDFIKEQDFRHVWTWVQGDLSDLIVPGIAYVNRLGYYVTEVPWENDLDYVLLSVEVECSCYNEEGYPNGEWGDEDCDKCEGYGYVTEYVG